MNKLKDLVESTPDFAELMRTKSNAIIEADSLKGRGERVKALALYAEAARLEYLISEFLADHGLHAEALTSLMSCASCWYCADELHAARSITREALSQCRPKDTRMRVHLVGLLDKIEAALAPPRSSVAHAPMRNHETAKSSRG